MPWKIINMPRPYISFGIDQLEKLVAQRSGDREVLQKVLNELENRRTQRARSLALKVTRLIGEHSVNRRTVQPDLFSDATIQSNARPEGSKQHQLTDEQKRVVSVFGDCDNLKVIAYAGAGKTSTLVALGESTKRRGLYLSFNRRNADEAKGKFCDRVDCRTTHSLALRTIRSSYDQEKLFGKLSAALLQEKLRIQDMSFPDIKVSARQTASLVLHSINKWLYSDLPGIEQLRVPSLGTIARWDTNVRTQIENYVVQLAQSCWQMMIDKQNPLPLTHDGYVKLWALSDPKFTVDYVLLDEAQDTNPVILDVLRRQHVQIVYVGDPHQQIYEWRGAVNAMEEIETRQNLKLTQSFRFGREIADLANQVLAGLHETVPLRGNPKIHSTIGPTNPDAILARTNATLIAKVVELVGNGRKVGIQGGTAEQIAVLKGLIDIKAGTASTVPELFGINNWNELQEFIKTDEGQQIATLVRLAEAKGLSNLVSILQQCTDGTNCDILLSTLHKAKGLEWDKVQLMPDFAPSATSKARSKDKPSLEELRILYVAITRARSRLDVPEEVKEFIRSLSAQKNVQQPQHTPVVPPQQPAISVLQTQNATTASTAINDATPPSTSSTSRRFEPQPQGDKAPVTPTPTKEPAGCMTLLFAASASFISLLLFLGWVAPAVHRTLAAQ